MRIFVLTCLFFVSPILSHATLETAEVLPSGVPNFILEGQYNVNQNFGSVGSAASNFGATYHFGIGFEIGPIPFDFDLNRRFGPSFATESVAIFETQFINSSWWNQKIPLEASFLYGVTAKSDDIRRTVQGSSTVYAARLGLLTSKHFKTKYLGITPFAGFQGDIEFVQGTNFASHLNLGFAVKPWFLDLVRFYFEGQVNLRRDISAISMGLEVVLVPIVEKKAF